MKSPRRRYSRINAALLLASAIALTAMIATDAAGVQMDVIPSVRLQEEWQSNVFDSPTNEVSSFGTRLTPSLAFKFTSVDNVMLRTSGSYDKVWYHDAEAKDADTDTWYFRIDSTGGWNLAPTFSILPSVYYLNTTNSVRRSQLVPSGDPVLPPVTITNFGNTKSADFGGAVNFNYLATPNWTVGVSGNYSERRFSDVLDNTADSGLTNSTSTGGNASVSYLFSPRTRLGIIVAGNRQTYDNTSDSDTLSAGILFGYQFSPTLRLDGAFGMSFIRRDAAPGIPEERESSPSGLFSFTYTTETFAAKGYGSAVYSGGSGFGESTRQYTAGFALSDKFTREWSGTLSGAYQVSRSVFDTDTVDLNTIYGSAGLSYQPLEWVSMDLTGNLNRQTSDGRFGDTIDNYSALLGFTIGKPYKIF